MLCNKGELAFNANMLKKRRIDKDKEESAIFEVLQITTTIRHHWGSEKADKKDLHWPFIVIPDTGQFNGSSYDTFKYFRAKKIYIDDLTIFLSKAETVTLTITVDLVNLEGCHFSYRFLSQLNTHKKSDCQKDRFLRVSKTY